MSWVHGDIKPANMAFSEASLSSTLKLLDFTGSESTLRAAGARYLYGTALYCSRRIHKRLGCRPVDDLESLVYVVYEMVMGLLPWEKAKDESEILSSKEKRIPAFLQLPSLPYWLKAWLEEVWNARMDENMVKLHERLKYWIAVDPRKRRKTVPQPT